MNDYSLEQLVQFLTQEMNTLDLILTSLPSPFQDINSPDILSDPDAIAGTLKITIANFIPSFAELFRLAPSSPD